ncbi:recombinase family protein [Sphingorhabdus lutea]|nr:recombinase family protein [Sphingorhabdus lutea]
MTKTVVFDISNLSQTIRKPALYDMARIGYARVSTCEQTLDLQTDALKAANCDRIFTDKGISAIAKSRPGFKKALSSLRHGDSLVLWKMDRAFRSLRHALDILDHFERDGIDFMVLTEGIDTTTPMGRCFFQIRNAFGELERNLISERTVAGLAAARKRGVKLGRPCALTPKQILDARRRKSAGEDMSVIAEHHRVNVRTLYRAVNGC